ncbi:MAG: hypothetical protein ACKO37_03900 [Vampirovibrionales bacterium]
MVVQASEEEGLTGVLNGFINTRATETEKRHQQAVLKDKDLYSYVPHPLSATSSRVKIIALLLKQGAEVNDFKSSEEASVLDMAIVNTDDDERIEVIQLLLKAGAKLNCMLRAEDNDFHFRSDEEKQKILEILKKAHVLD